MKTKILFNEQQRFTQWWLWVILAAVIFLPLYGLVQQLQLAHPFSNPEITTGILLSLVVVLPLGALFFLMRLRTQINEQGIAVQFYPLHLKFQQFNWAEIEQVYVRQYSPLSEYGGWGWRYGLGGSGKAYNISGNKGIQILFKNGKKLLIGTKKPEAAAAALKQLIPAK